MPTDCQQLKNTRALDYFRERGGFVIENECGWLNYYVDGNKAALMNFYIYPEFRNTQKGTALLNHLEMELVKLRGVIAYGCQVAKNIGMPESVLKILPKRGFKLMGENETSYFFFKEL